MPPDGFPVSLSDLRSDSLDGQAPTGLIGEIDQLTRNGHSLRQGPRAQNPVRSRLQTEEEFDHFLQSSVRRPPVRDLPTVEKHCDKLWSKCV